MGLPANSCNFQLFKSLGEDQIRITRKTCNTWKLLKIINKWVFWNKFSINFHKKYRYYSFIHKSSIYLIRTNRLKKIYQKSLKVWLNSDIWRSQATASGYFEKKGRNQLRALTIGCDASCAGVAQTWETTSSSLFYSKFLLLVLRRKNGLENRHERKI